MTRINYEHFNIYRNEKYILANNLSFKKCHVGLDLSKLDSEEKNNTFQFYKDEKYINLFTKINSKLFNIYRDKKHMLEEKKTTTPSTLSPSIPLNGSTKSYTFIFVSK